MASSPRMSLTLDPRTYSAIKRLSEAQGRSMGAVIRDFMGEATPVLERVAGAIERANQLVGEAPGTWASDMKRAQDVLEPILAKLLEHMDQDERAQDDLSGDAPSRVRAPGRASRGGADLGMGDGRPPTSNTGVRNG